MADTPPTMGTLTPDEFRRVREIFEAALKRPVGERRAFVDHACADNRLLLSQIKQMLDADETGNSLLDARDAAGSKDRATRVTTCRSCGTGLAANHRFCPACGTPIAAPGEEGRFRAGALFAGRFRIAGALGRGGMGDVYRADDLELGHPVALKFLTAFRNDERARSRLRNEVRLARQVSHPNVCRVFDIGEAQGELYLSMEYVDGEDLAALLRRIGRVPTDKGLEIARKLCAGLAAAHAKGVLHRDFKPANIMIDARGEVRIMDFGLAAIAERVEAADVRSGTPAYMSPEQLAGREATVRSDLYALGLVLYELFTGKAPFAARDVRELAQERRSHPVTTPSTLIPDLDAKIERTILRCLEPDPEQRPATALEVSAALPGGDPTGRGTCRGGNPITRDGRGRRRDRGAAAAGRSRDRDQHGGLSGNRPDGDAEGHDARLPSAAAPARGAAHQGAGRRSHHRAHGESSRFRDGVRVRGASCRRPCRHRSAVTRSARRAVAHCPLPLSMAGALRLSTSGRAADPHRRPDDRIDRGSHARGIRICQADRGGRRAGRAPVAAGRTSATRSTARFGCRAPVAFPVRGICFGWCSWRWFARAKHPFHLQPLQRSASISLTSSVAQ